MGEQEPTPEEIADGFALWEEHKPQVAGDWVAVAERWLAAGESTEESSPLFAAVVLTVQRAERAERALAGVERLLDEAGVPRHADDGQPIGVPLRVGVLRADLVALQEAAREALRYVNAVPPSERRADALDALRALLPTEEPKAKRLCGCDGEYDHYTDGTCDG